MNMMTDVLMRSLPVLMVLASMRLRCVMAYLSVLIVQTKLHAVSC